MEYSGIMLQMGEGGSDSRVTIRGEPEILVIGEIRSLQDGKWMIRWSSPGRLPFLNRMMNFARAVYNIQCR